ncbi:MAG: DNA-processing protein DprA [Deltaproteobacteria bacterium]|nr:DNA-processing protein DprA [Deltaproteobacteria bacterium]
MERHRYTPEHPDYPSCLRDLDVAPTFTATGPLPPARAVAIVGARSAVSEALDFARRLSFLLAERGITIVSGGAVGIDTAAHRGALEAGGATWVVCPNGADHVVPRENADLFEEIAESPSGRLVWPFEDHVEAKRHRFLHRNGILVALAEVVVVIQAHVRSGSRNAASQALQRGRQVWMPAAPPWGLWKTRFGGSLESIERGEARVLTSEAHFLRELGLEPPEPILEEEREAPVLLLNGGPETVPDSSWSLDERRVFSALSRDARHLDEVAFQSTLPIGQATTALLTLSTRDVVVEGPEGFFRRKIRR